MLGCCPAGAPVHEQHIERRLCLKHAKVHLTGARATSDARCESIAYKHRPKRSLNLRPIWELAADLENGPTIAEISDALIAHGAKS